MKKETPPLRFEERLESLEKLTALMEEGSLGLEEMLKLYEQGIRLAEGLKKDLEAARVSLMALKDGKLEPVEGE